MVAVFGVGGYGGGGDGGMGDGVWFFEEEGDRGPDVGEVGRFLESAGTASCRGRAVYLVMHGILERALAGRDGGAGIWFGLRASVSVIVVVLGVGIVRRRVRFFEQIIIFVIFSIFDCSEKGKLLGVLGDFPDILILQERFPHLGEFSSLGASASFAIIIGI